MHDPAATWELPADLTAGAVARRLVADFLAQADPGRPAASPELREACELVASELAVNAVRHGRPPATLALRRDGDGVRVAVTSRAGEARPAVGEPDAESTHGRGLAIVARLAEELDWVEAAGRITVQAWITA